MSRPGNNPKRRIAPADYATDQVKQRLEESARYVGSGHHKRNPADYGLPRTSPRPTKSLCDLERVILLDEAKLLVTSGIRRGCSVKFVRTDFPNSSGAFLIAAKCSRPKPMRMVPASTTGIRWRMKMPCTCTSSPSGKNDAKTLVDKS